MVCQRGAVRDGVHNTQRGAVAVTDNDKRIQPGHNFFRAADLTPRQPHGRIQHTLAETPNTMEDTLCSANLTTHRGLAAAVGISVNLFLGDR